MSNDSFSNRPRVIKALHLLESKVGGGKVDQKQIDKMQNVMDNNTVDFAPMAAGMLEQLSQAITAARKDTTSQKQRIAMMTDPVMQLKANGAMFGYDLVSILANIVLCFLESIDSVDNDVLDIVDAHHKTLTLIIGTKISGTGGNHGVQLETELREACKRYFVKKGGDITFSAPQEELLNPSDE